MTTPPATESPRTYAQWLRLRSDPDLAELLDRRPDLLHPPPEDLADLAARATTSSSVARALRHLNAWQATVVEAMAALETDCTVEEVAELLDHAADPAPVAEAITSLRAGGVAWDVAGRHRLVREARVAAGSTPGGLAPTSPRPMAEADIDAALAEVTAAERALLERLVWGPPTGRVGDAAQRPQDSPVGRLLTVGLLRVHDETTVVLPREVAWRLREPRRLLADQPSPVPPPITVTDPSTTGAAAIRSPRLRATLANQTAVATAAELVHDVEACCEWAGQDPVRLLRDGGLGVRDVNAVRALLGTSPARAALVIELGRAADLVVASGQHTLLPTTRYDQWLGEPTGLRWQRLVVAWRDLHRWPVRGLQPGHHVLGTESAWNTAAELRTIAIAQLRTLATDQAADRDGLAQRIGWLRPVWARAPWSLGESVTELWSELQWLGLIGEDGHPSVLLAHESGPLPADISFPDPVTEVIVQADLTAVAPGPLAAEVARSLRLLADQESRGAGAVFRFGPSTIRRAFDAGWSHEEVSTWLGDHSVTPIPQPLEYLVADTARRHGAVRVGAAWCYVRTEDEAQASAVLAHPSARTLGLRAIAPGVLVASAEPDEVVTLLQEMGLHPAAEDESGHTVTAPEPVRAPAPRRGEAAPSADPVGTVAALRHRERRKAELAAATTDIISTVRQAYDSGAPLRVSYVRADGTAAHTTAVPIAVGSGTVRLSGPDGTWNIPLSRVVATAPAVSEDQ